MFLDNEAKTKTCVEEYYDDEDLDETVDWEAEFDEDHDELTGIGKLLWTFTLEYTIHIQSPETCDRDTDILVTVPYHRLSHLLLQNTGLFIRTQCSKKATLVSTKERL